MIIFLLFFLTVYTLAHYYVLSKARKADLPLFRNFGRRREPTILLAFFVLFLVSGPILVRLLERASLEFPAEILAYLSYTWMGLIFLFISLAIFTDLIRFILYLIARVLRRPAKEINTKKQFVTQLLMILAVYCYGFYEAGNIRTEHIVISSPKIPGDIEKIRLVQISDVHLGLIVENNRLTEILAKIDEAKPDILIATGDLVDGQPDNLEEISRRLADFQLPMGKLAVTGNHEFYAGLDEALPVIREAGFRVLRNQSLTLGKISFTGIDDPTALRVGLKIPETTDLLEDVPEDNFKILLKHRPVITPESIGKFDLQLSGHTHKGQIFPFNLITSLFYPRPSGLSRISQKTYLYHSRGTGTWGPPIRVLSPPEITIIDLISAKESVAKKLN